jgi:hypothetical protein
MFGTIVVYALIFLSIQAKSHLRSRTYSANAGDPAMLKRAAKYMIIYPIVYVVCTLPLAGARMASMRGMVVEYWWFCLAGSAIASCGWLDVVLYAMTRRVLIFSADPPPANDFGLDTIGWKHSGEGFWGTTTTISGPISHVKHESRSRSFFNRASPHVLRHRHSDEDHLANHPERVITTKMTVDVHTGVIQNYAESTELSVMDAEERIEQAHSR